MQTNTKLMLSFEMFIFSSPGKESTCIAGDLGLILGWEDPLEKGKFTYSSILAWKTP